MNNTCEMTFYLIFLSWKQGIFLCGFCLLVIALVLQGLLKKKQCRMTYLNITDVRQRQTRHKFIHLHNLMFIFHSNSENHFQCGNMVKLFFHLATMLKRKLFSYKDLFASLPLPRSLSLTFTYRHKHTHAPTQTHTIFPSISLSHSLDIFVGHIGSLVFDQFNNNDILFSQSSRLTGSRVTSYK